MEQEKRSIFSVQSVPEFLSSELEARIQLNPRYSLRAFSKNLQMSPGELSEIMRGIRPVTLKVSKKIAQAFEMSPAEFRQLLSLAASTVTPGERVSVGHEAPLRAGVLRGQSLDEDRFRLISDWWCFAILSLTECSGFEWDSAWISKRLGISIASAEQAMERLERLNLVVKSTSKSVVVTDPIVEHLTTVPSTAVRRYHRSLLEKAIAALDEQSIDERDITGIGFSLDSRDLSAVKSEIADFQDRLLAKYARGTSATRRRRKPDGVYQLEMALFRLTQKEPKQ